MANRMGVPAAFARPLRVMLHFLGSVLLAGVAWPAMAATTYMYNSAPTYNNFNNFTASPCSVGTCANYTSSMNPSGSFTSAAPLAANLVNTDIAALVTSFSFSDGINTYTSPNGRIITFHVYTDASGVPTNSTTIERQEWMTESNPHTMPTLAPQVEGAMRTRAMPATPGPARGQ